MTTEQVAPSIEMKVCARCGGEKPITSFRTTRYKGKLYRRNPCQACASRAWRKRHPALAKLNADRAEATYRSHNWVRKWKLMLYIGQTACKKCGEADIRALAFHHRGSEEKLFGIAQGMSRCYSFERMAAEAKKCDILCQNCHAKEHTGNIEVILESLKSIVSGPFEQVPDATACLPT
jgi:hypothetical protein